jgi:3',5'-cyclic AMP phosphodiesterase CpdA
MASDRSITILHVSDMQFGVHHQFGAEEIDHFDSLLERIWNDISLLRDNEGLKPDLLICTGDLAEWAWSREFADAMRFLGVLAERLDIKRDRVIIIPGNHDVNRKDCRRYFEEFIEGGDPIVAPWYPKWKKYEKAFNDFYQGMSGAIFQSEQPWSLFRIPELEVVVAGLNSTWIEGHDWPDDDKNFDQLKVKHAVAHAGMCGTKQLRWFADKLCADEFAGWLKVGAIHHNLERNVRSDNENLRDAEELERLLGPHLHIVLHGHTHRARWNWVRDSFPWFATGSAGLTQQIRPYGVPNQYQFLLLSPDGVRVRARYYLSDEDKWANDPRLGEGNQIGTKHVAVPWRNVRRFVQAEKLLNLEEFLLEYHGGLSAAAAAAQAAVLEEDPEPNIKIILTLICTVVTAWSNKRDKPKLKVYANYQKLCAAETLSEEEKNWIQIRTYSEASHFLVAKASSLNAPLEGLALQVDFSTDKTAAIPGSPTAIVTGESQYIDDTSRIQFPESLSPEARTGIQSFFERHYDRFKSCAAFVLRNVAAAELDERKKPVAVLNIEASETQAFGETPDEKGKTHRMLQPVICMLETAVGSRTLRKTLEKISPPQ